MGRCQRDFAKCHSVQSYLEGHVHVLLHVALVVEDVLEAGGHVGHDLRQVLQRQALGHSNIHRLLEFLLNKMSASEGNAGDKFTNFKRLLFIFGKV